MQTTLMEVSSGLKGLIISYRRLGGRKIYPVISKGPSRSSLKHISSLSRVAEIAVLCHYTDMCCARGECLAYLVPETSAI
jgi:hypothetical protein